MIDESVSVSFCILLMTSIRMRKIKFLILEKRMTNCEVSETIEIKEKIFISQTESLIRIYRIFIFIARMIHSIPG